jgi:hypothetical protein
MAELQSSAPVAMLDEGMHQATARSAIPSAADGVIVLGCGEHLPGQAGRQAQP